MLAASTNSCEIEREMYIVAPPVTRRIGKTQRVIDNRSVDGAATRAPTVGPITGTDRRGPFRRSQARQRERPEAP